MKKTALLFILAWMGMGLAAQNIQLHYDFGKHLYKEDIGERQDLTLTYETFKADALGSWYYFVDADFSKDGVIGAYTELSREFKIGQKGFAAHIEYDGGLSKAGGVFQGAGLAGLAWNGHTADFTTTYSIQVLYKHFFGQEQVANTTNYASFQITGVWSTTFGGGRWTFAGFFDLWREKNAAGDGYLVFLSEPQLWYNLNRHVSFGTEVEVSNNFLYRSYPPFTNEKFYANPTVAVKVNL